MFFFEFELIERMTTPRIASGLNWRNQVNKSSAYSIQLRITTGKRLVTVKSRHR